MHYTLTDESGEVLDSSEGAQPLNYLHGTGSIIPGLEQALVGKVEGDALKVSVEPAEAYGEFDPNLIQVVDRAAFQGVDNIDVGMSFEARGPDGGAQRIMVKSVEDDKVTVDAKTFDFTIVYLDIS